MTAIYKRAALSSPDVTHVIKVQPCSAGSLVAIISYCIAAKMTPLRKSQHPARGHVLPNEEQNNLKLSDGSTVSERIIGKIISYEYTG